MLDRLVAWWGALTPTDLMWLAIGLTGQAMFSARWILQWVASEQNRRSTMPEIFWYFSFAGGICVLLYGLHRMDPVIILGQFGILIYARNLFFLNRAKRAALPLPQEASDATRLA